jgi:hypothetical protein
MFTRVCIDAFVDVTWPLDVSVGIGSSHERFSTNISAIGRILSMHYKSTYDTYSRNNAIRLNSSIVSYLDVLVECSFTERIDVDTRIDRRVRLRRQHDCRFVRCSCWQRRWPWRIRRRLIMRFFVGHARQWHIQLTSILDKNVTCPSILHECLEITSTLLSNRRS